MTNQKDYYEILGVEKGASPKKIKEAYRKVAFQYHPDRNRENPSAAEKMKEINEAYAVLSDPKKRNDYDRFHEQYGPDGYDRFKQSYSEQDIFRGSDINQIFEEMARAFGFRGFEEVFKESYGQRYQSFEFRRPGVFGKGFIFFGPAFGKSNQQEIPISSEIFPGFLGKLTHYLLKKACWNKRTRQRKRSGGYHLSRSTTGPRRSEGKIRSPKEVNRADRYHPSRTERGSEG